MTSPLRLLPTNVLVAMASEHEKPPARERIIEYIKKRDGPLAVLFKRVTLTSPASTYGVTFSELVNEIGLSVPELVETGLVASWMDCVALKMTLSDVLPPHDGPRYARCNIHVLRKQFGPAFDANLKKDPLKIGIKALTDRHAPNMRPEDFQILGVSAEGSGAYWLNNKHALTAGARNNIATMLLAGTREQWVSIGLPYDDLIAL